jgi:hypothetical protein
LLAADFLIPRIWAVSYQGAQAIPVSGEELVDRFPIARGGSAQ